MTETRSYRALQWMDIDSPTPHEVTALVDKFKLNPLVGEELLRPTRKAKIDAYKDHIYIVLHIPVRGSGKEFGIKEKEIDFIIGKKFIITSDTSLLSRFTVLQNHLKPIQYSIKVASAIMPASFFTIL
jgi:Mg2+ and Co2+ transporter CorA